MPHHGAACRARPRAVGHRILLHFQLLAHRIIACQMANGLGSRVLLHACLMWRAERTAEASAAHEQSREECEEREDNDA